MGERISAAVMAHPSRLGRARALRDRHPELGLRIVTGPDGPQSALRTAQAAWATADPGASHHLVVQDDAILCDGFAGRLAAAVAARPRDALCLFTEWGSASSFVVRLAALGGHGFAEVMEHYAPTVAAVLPTELARAFAGWGAPGPQDDVALRAFLLHEGVTAAIPVPNLADHDPGPSLTGNDFMGARRSACFPTAAAPAGSLLRAKVVPYFSWTEGYPACSVRADDAGSRWRRESPGWFLSGHGVDPESAVALGRDAIAPLAGSGIPPVALFGLWTTAFCLGVRAAATGPVDPHRPEAALALASMPAGSLRAVATEAQLRDPRLTGLVTAAVLGGAAARNA